MTSTLPDGTTQSETLPTPGTPLSSSKPNPLALIAELEKQAKVIDWVNTKYEELKNARVPFERQWHINLAFYAGRQNIAPVTTPGGGFRLVAPKAPPWRVRLVINKIRTAVRTECSKLTSSKPIPIVIPATTEDQDFAAARVAEQILKSTFSNEDFESIVRRWVWWGSITGKSYMKSYWNPNETDERAYVTPELPPELAQMAQMLQGMIPPQPAKGKIIVEAVTPFHLYVPDLMEEDLELQPYVMHVTTKTPLWVLNNFNIQVTPDARASNSLLESAVLSPVGAANQQFDSVLVKEVWIKPGGHPEFPQGGIVTVVGGKAVQFKTEWPLTFKEYPFYPYEGIPTGGFYTESVVTDLIPLQKEYNKTKSQIIEIKNLMGKPKLMAPKGSINPRQISSEPGQAILYTPGYEKPTVLPAAEVPQTMLVELDRLISDFDDISGQHEITRGNTPSQVTSGTAISFLQEQDDSKLAYQVAGIERAIAKLGRHYLNYAVNYWEDERLVKIVGKDGDFEAKTWKKSSMQGNTDVIVQSGSALPQSKAAKQALVTDLMAQGFLDPTVGMELMDMGGLDKILEDFLIDKRQAQRENLRMAELPPEIIQQANAPLIDPETGQPLMDPNTGQPVMPQPQAIIKVNSFDNHQAHIHFHNQFRKTQQFELLSPEIKQQFELHVQTHQMALMLPQQGAAGIVSTPEGQGPPMGEPPMEEPPMDEGPPVGEESSGGSPPQ